METDSHQTKPLAVQKGRGALSNLESRFVNVRTETVDDGWYQKDATEAASTNTEFFADATKTLITRNKSPDVPFDRSINAYKGCEHGCIYCFARPTHAFLDLSPGLDFETKIFYKTQVAECLTSELAKPRYSCAPIAMGTNTDPYQPIEKTERITRKILEILLDHKHPCTLVTKSTLILRDLDLLSELAKHNLVTVMISMTSLDNKLKVTLEPRTASAGGRLRTLRELIEAGIPTGVLMAPIIPCINDSEMEAIVDACFDQGARVFRYVLLRLPREVSGLFREWLAQHYPDRAQKVMSVVRETRGGKDYSSQWHQRRTGEGAFAELIRHRFKLALRRHGIQDEELPELDCSLFKVPTPQGSLF